MNDMALAGDHHANFMLKMKPTYNSIHIGNTVDALCITNIVLCIRQIIKHHELQNPIVIRYELFSMSVRCSVRYSESSRRSAGNYFLPLTNPL